ncbi:MAG: DUF5131 family protein [Patescibacteria group bacterium]|nr:DUF5131 family protein [Patescibacteria group bacterium]
MKWNAEAEAAGERRRVFCASLADVFEKWTGNVHRAGGFLWHRDDIGICSAGQTTAQNVRGERLATLNDVRRRLFTEILNTPWLDWLLLTKRPENIISALQDVIRDEVGDSCLSLMVQGWLRGDAPSNVWLGTSCENQAAADERIPHLLKVPAVVRFLSCEPMLGPVDLKKIAVPRDEDQLRRAWDIDGYKFNCLTEHDDDRFHQPPATIGWVIVGGESGPGARPMRLAWVRSLTNQCRSAGVPCFVKQLGGNMHDDDADEINRAGFVVHDRKGGNCDEWPTEFRVRDFPIGKDVAHA